MEEIKKSGFIDKALRPAAEKLETYEKQNLSVAPFGRSHRGSTPWFRVTLKPRQPKKFASSTRRILWRSSFPLSPTGSRVLHLKQESTPNSYKSSPGSPWALSSNGDCRLRRADWVRYPFRGERLTGTRGFHLASRRPSLALLAQNRFQEHQRPKKRYHRRHGHPAAPTILVPK